jgi:hypothetical protein
MKITPSVEPKTKWYLKIAQMSGMIKFQPTQLSYFKIEHNQFKNTTVTQLQNFSYELIINRRKKTSFHIQSFQFT